MFNLGKAMKKGLEINKLCQTDFAASMGVSPQYINKLCNSKSTGVSVERLMSLAKAFDVELSEFVSWGEQRL